MSSSSVPATRPDGSSGVSSSQSQGGNGLDWVSLSPKRIDEEDALGADANRAVWEKVYRASGKAQAGEKERAGIRLAVYVYGALNGTSREGNYNGECQCFDGTKFAASIIPQSTGRMNIRKFFRANMLEAYDALKSSRVMETYQRFLSKAASLSVSPEAAFATADFLADCPKFTPSETRAHDAAFTRGIERARRARGGRGLEEVEHGRMTANMEAQGADASHHGPVDF